jgi:hypothetical protein
MNEQTTKTAYIPAKAIDWVIEAAATNAYRKALADAAVVWIKGTSWLLATDTMRVHLVRLFQSEEHEVIKVNLRRVRHEMKFVRANALILTMDGGKLSHEIAVIKWGELDRDAVEDIKATPCKVQQSYSPILRECKEQYPNIPRVIPEKVTYSNGAPLNMQQSLLSEAMSLHNGGSLLTVSVVKPCAAGLAPIVILPRLGPFSSFAVVMPMALESKNMDQYNEFMEDSK